MTEDPGGDTVTAVVVFSETGATMIGCELAWRRDGADWILLHKRRRMGRVTPDKQYPGMYRIVLSRDRLSDMANLSWAKNAVLEAATRELDYEARHRPVIAPPKPQQIASVFESGPAGALFRDDR